MLRCARIRCLRPDRFSSARAVGRCRRESSSSPWSGCAARLGYLTAPRRTRFGILSQRICSAAAAICARSRNCSATPRSRPRRSTPASTASGFWKCTRARTRVGERPHTPPTHSRHIDGFLACLLRSRCGSAIVRRAICRRGIMGAHESMEHAEHAEHASGSNKKIALLIAVIALFLALSETLGKGAQTEAISKNVEASNLWAFFQAKSIRRTVVQATAEHAKLSMGTVGDEASKAALQKQIDDWNKTAARYRSEPETGEGSEELAKRAKHAEHERDEATAKYHHYEIASAAFQIGIVLASATIITGMIVLAWVSGLLAVAGIGITLLGPYAPPLLHLHCVEALNPQPPPSPLPPGEVRP